MCETRRPSEECAAVPRGPYTTASLAPVGQLEAVGMCTDLVELNSFEEVAIVEDLAKQANIDRFWLAPVHSNGKWASPGRNCPSVFPWAGEPLISASPMCVVYIVNLGASAQPCSDMASVICEH
jgi:hypothetical protein